MKRILNEPPSEIVALAKIQYEGAPKHLKKNIDSAKAALKEFGQIKVNLIVSISRPQISSRKRPKEGQPALTKPGMFTVRSGGNELEAARELGWKEMKAIVVPEECPTLDVIPEWVKVLERHIESPLSDYEIATTAIDMEKRFQVQGGMFANIMGISKPYTYNLMRWYRHAPQVVRNAWEEQHPLINHTLLENFTHFSSSEEIVAAWKSRTITMSSSFQPYKPGRNGYAKKDDFEPKVRRASEKQIALLLEAVSKSQLITPVKELCAHIIKFTLGARKDVPGLTRRQNFHPSLVIDKDA